MSDANVPARLEPGAVFGDFGVVRELGRGSFGAVYEARHQPSGRPMALKVLDARYATHAEARARFRREAEANASLTHPNIVQVLASGEVDGRPYVALECLDGDTLAARLARVGRLPVAEVAGLGSAVASALAHVHALGLVHRDIKPGNIFLAQRDGREVPVLLDFGVVKVTPGLWDVRLTRKGQLLGSPAYMSPEQARALPLDARSDQFSLGVILWECLAGRRLFTGAAVWQVLDAVRAARVPDLAAHRPDAPPELVDAVHRALAPDPDARFAHTDDLADALRAFVAPRGPSVTAPRRAPTARPPAPPAATAPAVDLHLADRAAALARVQSFVLDRYRLVGLLGVGGVAAVYAASDLRTGNVVALKVLHPSVATDRVACARFARESQVTRSLAHPAIPRWLDGGHDLVLGQVMVMSFVDGVDLGTVVDHGGPLSLVDALRLGARLAEALECAHAAGVVHRDVKPENVLLVGGHLAPDALRLVDFGLAHCLDATRLTETRVVEGSACYLAPEQVRGDEVSPATDLYALGATLVTLLTGAPPFEGDYLAQLGAHVSAAPPLLRARRGDVPDAVERCVLQLLEKDPSRRPQRAAEVAARLDELARWLAGEGDGPAPDDTILRADSARDIVLEIERASERLQRSRASLAAAHGRIVDQLVALTSRQLARRRHAQAAREGDPDAIARLAALGDPAADAKREAALEASLERLQAQSSSEQARIIAALGDLERRLAALR